MIHRQRTALFEARSVLLFAALTMGSTSALMAQSAKPAAASSDQAISAAFTRADKDGDKALSAEEAKTLPAVSQQFARIDANGDGAISLEEFTAAMKDGQS